MGYLTTWKCVWCGHQYSDLTGSKFVYRKENGLLIKRRKCSNCLNGVVK